MGKHNLYKIFMQQRYCEEVINMRNQGQAALIATMFLLAISLVVVFGASVMAARESRVARLNTNANASYFLAEAGVEDAYYRLLNAKNISAQEIITINSITATTDITQTGSTHTVIAAGDASLSARKVKGVFEEAPGAGGFHYGVQIGAGGLTMENNSTVNGNVYSNGNIDGSGSPVITGDAIAVGTISSPDPIVTGTRTQGAPSVSMPISDEAIESWKTAAVAGGTISSPCPYEPANGTTLGPKKITCDVNIKNDNVITLTGPVWITGTLTLQNNAIVRLHASYGANSEAIVADNPTNKTTSSKIIVQDNAQVLGSGTSGSYVLLISQNNSAELGGTEIAIEPKNNSTAPVYYAPHGLVLLQNNIVLKEVTAYKIEMKNNAVLTYESGLTSPVFTSGPTGGFTITSWNEIE